MHGPASHFNPRVSQRPVDRWAAPGADGSGRLAARDGTVAGRWVPSAEDTRPGTAQAGAAWHAAALYAARRLAPRRPRDRRIDRLPGRTGRQPEPAPLITAGGADERQAEHGNAAH